MPEFGIFMLNLNYEFSKFTQSKKCNFYVICLKQWKKEVIGCGLTKRGVNDCKIKESLKGSLLMGICIIVNQKECHTASFKGLTIKSIMIF